ncbi:YybH family protein [Paucibacter sp. Y2R2-4]|uniref:YybH family protein n=1 Tax=Paucibacter sp. Y2R2-4 TaxID=2893553 RepID=UPI0021E4E79F|nr:tetratricopeptide repeat protein [Paucibacter sp. Y2R2-4]MCV2349864.1 tetratricopeptide repeat protein [Paucibacter sp. Y2R2-4]
MSTSKAAPMTFSLRSICLATSLALGMSLAWADDVTDVQAILAAGKHAEGLKKVDQLLVAKPNDPRLRLQRGIALSLLNRQAEAIGVFQKLTETHPELPGPYNNLAVLYGNQGDYEKARQALELAIRTNPTYATAFQNLGDVYARLAGQAYKKALALDKTDGTLPLKLAVVQNVFEASVDPRAAKPVSATPAPTATPAPSPAPSPAAAVTPSAAANPAQAATAKLNEKAAADKKAAESKVADAKPADSKVAVATPATPAKTPAPAVTNSPAATPTAAAPSAAKPAASSPASTTAATTTVASATPAKAGAAKPESAKPDATDKDKQAVEKALHAWAKAWSQRDMFAYYAAYAPEFKGKSPTRKAWEQERNVRITGKKKISVSLSNLQIKVSGDKASVRLRQDYSSDALSVKSSKSIEMIKNKLGDWQITQETSN